MYLRQGVRRRGDGMTIMEIRAFVPCIDFKVCRQFYIDLGFEIGWEDDKLIEFGRARQSFFLQNYYVKEWADNCMLQLLTDDLDALYQQAKGLAETYDHVKIKAIFKADYGRTFHLIDPTGVLWHMTEDKQ